MTTPTDRIFAHQARELFEKADSAEEYANAMRELIEESDKEREQTKNMVLYVVKLALQIADIETLERLHVTDLDCMAESLREIREEWIDNA